MSQGKIFGTIILLLILGGVAGVFLRKNPKSEANAPAQKQESIASSTAPSLVRKVSFSQDLPREARGILKDKIAKLQTSLSKNYDDFAGWMNLAIQYKTAGDYDGAREIWEYESYLHPNESISLHNLGDFYHRHLKDYARAENYYKRAIDADPTQAISYLALHELYRYSYKQNTSAAVDILKTAIARVKGNQIIDLYSALGSYYEDKKDYSNAIIYYTKARDAAQKAGNTALVVQLDAQLASLKNN